MALADADIGAVRHRAGAGAWAARRIAKPLRSLAEATRRFRPGETDGPVAENGPQDVRDVIAAYNALRLRVTAMLDEKDRMLGAIGHDLRTPLAALRVRIEYWCAAWRGSPP